MTSTKEKINAVVQSITGLDQSCVDLEGLGGIADAVEDLVGSVGAADRSLTLDDREFPLPGSHAKARDAVIDGLRNLSTLRHPAIIPNGTRIPADPKTLQQPLSLLRQSRKSGEPAEQYLGRVSSAVTVHLLPFVRNCSTQLSDYALSVVGPSHLVLDEATRRAEKSTTDAEKVVADGTALAAELRVLKEETESANVERERTLAAILQDRQRQQLEKLATSHGSAASRHFGAGVAMLAISVLVAVVFFRDDALLSMRTLIITPMLALAGWLLSRSGYHRRTSDALDLRAAAYDTMSAIGDLKLSDEMKISALQAAIGLAYSEPSTLASDKAPATVLTVNSLPTKLSD